MTTTRCATASRRQDDQRRAQDSQHGALDSQHVAQDNEHRDRDSFRVDRRTRDFDYGVGDEVTQAVERTRAEVARWIRQAARSLPSLSAAEWSAYESAAAIAEQGGCRGASQSSERLVS